jgi:hypothetical protein
VSSGEGETITVPKPRAVGLLPVCLSVKPVEKPDAGNPHVRFDERGRETGRCRTAQATAPFLDSTNEPPLILQANFGAKDQEQWRPAKSCK